MRIIAYFQILHQSGTRKRPTIDKVIPDIYEKPISKEERDAWVEKTRKQAKERMAKLKGKTIKKSARK